MARRNTTLVHRGELAALGVPTQITDLDGTAYRTILVDSAGDVQELIHGTSGYVYTSNGPSADPSWQLAGGVNELTDLSDVNSSIVTNRYVLVADGVDYESRLLVEADISDLQTYLTSVAVSDLDNGVDGELLTWDASGVAATVAVGTAGHVLTSNGAGAAPTFQAGGGSSLVQFADNGLVAEVYYNSLLALDSHASGVHVYDTSGNDPYIGWMDSGGVRTAFIQTNSGIAMRMRSEQAGDGINLQATQALGGAVDLLTSDPDGSLGLYYDGGLVFETDDTGIHVHSSTGTTTTLRFYDNVATQNAVIFSGPTVSLSLRGSVAGGDVFIGGTDAGAAAVDLINMDPDGSVSLYYDDNLKFETQLSGVRVYTQTGGAAAVEFTDSTGSSRYGRLVATSTSFSFGANGHGATVSVTGEDSGGTPTFLMLGDPDAAVDLYYDGSIAISTEIGGASIYDTSGNDPRILLLDDVGTQVGLIQCLSGASMRIRNSHVSDPIALQGTNSGSAITTVCEGDPNGSFDLYFDGTAAFSTRSDDTFGTSVPATGMTALTRTMSGLELVGGGMNTTSKYTPALKLMSTDGNFTTENPKFLAAIMGEATETYSSDTDGGMNLAFFTTPNNPGATSLPQLVMKLRNNLDAEFQGDIYPAASTSSVLTAGSGHPEGAVTADIGSIFLRSDGAGASVYIKEAGTGNAGWHAVPTELSAIKESTTSRSSTTTLADDGDFVFALPNTGWYSIEGFLRVTSASATPDLKQAFAYSGTIVTGGYMFTGADNGAGTSSKDNVGVITNSTIIDCDGSDANGITIKGWVEVSTTGNFSYQWSQNVSNATAIQLQAGSWMKVSYIAL